MEDVTMPDAIQMSYAYCMGFQACVRGESIGTNPYACKGNATATYDWDIGYETAGGDTESGSIFRLDEHDEYDWGYEDEFDEDEFDDDNDDDDDDDDDDD